MGQFSWFTQDTNHRIVTGEYFKVIMTDDKGNKYVEQCYGGYGVFGGKDYYVLLGEMNGLKHEDYADEDEYRSAAISLAFKYFPDIHDNPDIKYPSLSECGKYYDGQPPETDPNQGFSEDHPWHV